VKMYSAFRKYRDLLERRIHQTDPRSVFESPEFPWATRVEQSHTFIKQEGQAILHDLNQVINFNDVLPNQRALQQGADWKSFYLVAMERPVPAHQERCPATTEALKQIPGVLNAFFSILQPGVYIPPHRGPYSGILRYHLGVIIPAGDVAIRVDQTICHWQEGKSLFFDDSFEHEAWNRTDSLRVVLFVDLVRPLPKPLSVINRAVLKAMSLSKEVRYARRTVLENQLAPSKSNQAFL
jgi:aspartyl/asparaginyl beta-hydroxylase (cupin superfamily)